MSKGLETLKTIRHIHDMECEKDQSMDNAFDTIVKELKVLKVIITLFDIKIVGDYLIAKRGDVCLVENLKLRQNQEIINLLKEVLL